MKKLTIILLALFFVGITNINAQTEAITADEVTTEEVKKECPFTKNADGKLVCVKTGKVCDTTCENKKNGTCCKGEKKKSCSKSKTKCSKEEKAACSKSKTKCSKEEKAACSKSKTKCSKGKEKSACCSKDKTSDKKSCCTKKSSGCSKSKSTDSKK